MDTDYISVTEIAGDEVWNKRILEKFGTTGRGTYYSLGKAQKAQ